MVSLPAPPVRTSLPSAPRSVSLPAPPYTAIVSDAAVDHVGAIAGGGARIQSVDRTAEGDDVEIAGIVGAEGGD
jgi:hypothetical protein